MNEEPVSVSKLVAGLIYVLLSIFIWFPIGYLCASVNLKLTVIIFLMALVKDTCKLYLGLK